MPTLVALIFPMGAIVSATPLFVAVIALHANPPSVVFLPGRGYDPPVRPLTVISRPGSWPVLDGAA